MSEIPKSIPEMQIPTDRSLPNYIFAKQLEINIPQNSEWDDHTSNKVVTSHTPTIQQQM